jgi:hypothetical protein
MSWCNFRLSRARCPLLCLSEFEKYSAVEECINRKQGTFEAYLESYIVATSTRYAQLMTIVLLKSVDYINGYRAIHRVNCFY